jgi:hypothetical protein
MTGIRPVGCAIYESTANTSLFYEFTTASFTTMAVIRIKTYCVNGRHVFPIKHAMLSLSDSRPHCPRQPSCRSSHVKHIVSHCRLRARAVFSVECPTDA